MNVDKKTTDFEMDKCSYFYQCPAGKFFYSFYRDEKKMDRPDAIYKGRCAQVNNHDKDHLNEYGNCYVQESYDGYDFGGRDYTCDKDGYYVAGFRFDKDCSGKPAITLKCCAPWL